MVSMRHCHTRGAEQDYSVDVMRQYCTVHCEKNACLFAGTQSANSLILYEC